MVSIKTFKDVRQFLFIVIILFYYSLVAFAQDSKIDSTNYPSTYLVLPSAYGLSDGQLYFENVNLGYFAAEYGFNNFLSAKASFEVFNPIFASEAPTFSIQPKIHKKISDHLHVAANFINVIAVDGDYISIPQAVVTIGGHRKNVSVGYGHIFYNFFSVKEQFDGISIGGRLELNNRWSLITDNWVLFNKPERSFANRFNFHSLGLSKNVKNLYHIDFGLTYFSEAEDFGKFPWPYVKFRTNSGVFFPHLKKIRPKKINRSKEIIGGKKIEKRKKAIYGEFFGIGYIYSLNYDVRLSDSSDGSGFGVRIGAGSYGATFFPLQVNYLMGGPQHFLEFASGLTLATSNFDFNNGPYGSFNVSPSSSIAFRFQPFNKGFFLRVSVDVFYDLAISEDGFQPWIGFGMGHSFR